MILKKEHLFKQFLFFCLIFLNIACGESESESEEENCDSFGFLQDPYSFEISPGETQEVKFHLQPEKCNQLVEFDINLIFRDDSIKEEISDYADMRIRSGFVGVNDIFFYKFYVTGVKFSDELMAIQIKQDGRHISYITFYVVE